MKKARVSIIRSGTKAVFLIPLVLIFAAYGLVGCERSAHLVVTTDNPPVIKVSGDALFDRLEVRGPLPERMNDDRPSLIWKLGAASSPPQLNELPAVTYGVVPAGFVQSEPKNVKPPDLVEGAIYSITVITRGPNHPAKTIVIRNGAAEEFRPGDYKVDNSNVSSFVPADVRTVQGTGRIYFVPVDYSPSLLDQLADYERRKYGVQVEIKPNVGAFSETYDVQTGQHVAEKIIARLKQQYPPGSAERAIYVALIPQDMYIKKQQSRFAYIYSEDGYAVISDARLAIFADEAQQKARLRKLINRAIGMLYFNLPYSDDRRSVLFKDLSGPDDLDRMSEDF